MTGLSVLDSYRSLFRGTGAARFFLPASLGRLGVAMTGLSVLWAVHGSTGSFGPAGFASGAFAAADAIAGPQLARLVDRFGQRRVVSLSGGCFVVLGTALVVASAAHRSSVLLIMLAALLGAGTPPVGALSAARWRHLSGAAAWLSSALSMEGSVNELSFLVGPVLVTTLGTAVTSWSGLALAVAAVATGLVGMLSHRSSEPAPSGRSAGLLLDRRLPSAPFVALLAANLGIGFFFGGIGVVITGFAFAHRVGALAGVITALGGAVSLVAGLVYGALRPAEPLPVMAGAAVLITIGTAMLSLVDRPVGMLVGYAGVGGAVALVLIPAAQLLQQATPREVYTQAMTWTNSASAVGIGVAAPLLGHVVQLRGWSTGFLVLAALTACLPVILVGGRRLLTGRVEERS